MSLVGFVCLSVGCLRHGFAWYDTLSATACLAMGIGFVAIVLLEFEWLERIIGVFGVIFVGLVQWFWPSDGSRSAFP